MANMSGKRIAQKVVDTVNLAQLLHQCITSLLLHLLVTTLLLHQCITSLLLHLLVHIMSTATTITVIDSMVTLRRTAIGYMTTVIVTMSGTMNMWERSIVQKVVDIATMDPHQRPNQPTNRSTIRILHTNQHLFQLTVTARMITIFVTGVMTGRIAIGFLNMASAKAVLMESMLARSTVLRAVDTAMSTILLLLQSKSLLMHRPPHLFTARTTLKSRSIAMMILTVL
mmetsp:Transcript_28594/g.50666  ORF Transcript_28594/g.50666 Transcript_28594/m.50666 type:complete len:227 (+) Transcript_28594:130-810(+)